MVPNCVSVEEANAAAIAAATAIAKKKSGNYDSKGFRKTPYKNPDAPNVKSNDERRREMKKEEYLLEKNVPTNPELWSRAKSMARSKFDVYPSAYANGWASKWYKSKGGGWKSQADESYINEGKKKIKLKKKLNQEDNSLALGYEFGNNGIGDEFGVVRSPNGLGMGYSLPMNGAYTMSESVLAWANKEETIERFINKYGEKAEQKLYEACQRLSELKSTSKDAKGFNGLREAWEAIGGRDMGTVPKQGKEEVDEASPAWQRKEGKNPTGGLNRKGIASYRRENPGSKLSLAVTTKPSKLKPGSKAAKRRKSFCARMGGMRGPMKDEKGRPTRKALSLRKWNCEE
jgi:hypothetical protein